MTLSETTQVPISALPVDGLRAHLRLGSGFAEDELQDEVLSSFLQAALCAVEAQTGKILIERDFEVIATDWASACPFPVAPVTSISKLGLIRPIADGETPAVTAVVTDLGIVEELDLTKFHLVKDFQSPKLRHLTACYPTVPNNGGVYVAFVAGMAASFDELPSDLRQAVLLLASHFYENRSDVGLPAGCMPFGVSSLLVRYRNVRLGRAL